MNTLVIVGIVVVVVAIISFMLLFKVIKWLAIAIVIVGLVAAGLFLGFGIWPLLKV